MSQKKNANEGSLDLPNYLRVSTERHKSSSPASRSSKKVFPQLRHGVSPDAPIEFHNRNSIIVLSSAKSVLLDDPAITHEKPKKVLGKDKLAEWPMKSVYTTDLDIGHVPHKIIQKSVRPKELYDCILNESRVVQRPDMVVGEETLYTRRFYEAIKDNKAFHRKKGYFEHFAKHHKMTNADYQVRRSNSNGHTRYISKPIIVTNLNSKNSMTSHGSELHNTILRDIQGRRTLTPLDLLTSEQSLVNKSHIEDRSASAKLQQTHTNTHETPQLLPQSKPSEKNSTSFQTHKHFYETYLKKNPQQTPEPERTTNQSEAETSRLLPTARKVKNIQRTRSIVAERERPSDASYAKSSRRDISGRSDRDQTTTFRIDQTQSFQTGHNSIRYKTKDITRLLSEQREQAIHVDPVIFVKHDVEVENRRNSDIKISVIDQRKRYSLANNGSPVRYVCASYREAGEEGEDTVRGNIAKFEKYIDRLRFTGKNFGTQRWCYEKNWKLEKLNGFDSQGFPMKLAKAL